MHTHEFKNSHGRYPITVDVLDRLQQDIALLEAAIVGLAGSSTVLVPPTPSEPGVIIGDGQLSRAGASDFRLTMAPIITNTPRSVEIEGKEYGWTERTGQLAPANAVSLTVAHDLPVQLAAIRSQLNQSLGELRAALAAKAQELTNNTNNLEQQLQQLIASANTAIDNVRSSLLTAEPHYAPKGAMVRVASSGNHRISASQLPDGWVCCVEAEVSSDLWKKQAAYFEGRYTFTQYTSTRGTYRRMVICNGVTVPNLKSQSALDDDNGGYMEWIIKCI